MRTRLRQTPRLRRLLRWLRKHYPPRTPTVVRVVAAQPGLHGLCLIGEGRALIRITSSQESSMADTLIEEWCHVLRWDCPVLEQGDHDSIFWAITGQVTVHWRGET